MKTKTKKRKTYASPYELAAALGIHYSGDASVEYGGLFYNTEHWESYGYADALAITDMDSGCGFAGGLLVERITILRREGDDMKSALECCGWIDTDEEITVHHEIDACKIYGYYEPAITFPDGHALVITTDPESRESDGWKAEAYISAEDLLGYIHAKHMGDF